jgi:ferritin
MADLSKALNDLINKQITNELYNANAYSQIAAYFGNFNLNNLKSKFDSQSSDERSHSQRFIDFLQDRIGGNVQIGAVEAVKEKLDDLQSIAKAYLAIEKTTTDNISAILDQAVADKDHMSYTVLQWFIDEQYKEEDEAIEFLNKAKMIGGNMAELVLWDASMS